METLLHSNTSIFGNTGQSTELANELTAHWLAQNADGHVIVRDFATDPIPHLSGRRFTAFVTPATERSAEQRAVVTESDTLIDELARANVLGLLGIRDVQFIYAEGLNIDEQHKRCAIAKVREQIRRLPVAANASPSRQREAV